MEKLTRNNLCRRIPLMLFMMIFAVPAYSLAAQDRNQTTNSTSTPTEQKPKPRQRQKPKPKPFHSNEQQETAIKDPVVETKLFNFESRLDEFARDINALKDKARALESHPTIQPGTATRLLSNWDILIGGIGWGCLAGLLAGAVLFHFFRRSVAEEYQKALSPAFSEFQSQLRGLKSGLGDLEKKVNSGRDNLPKIPGTETEKPAVEQVVEEKRQLTSGAPSSVRITSLADVGTLPPSQYIDAIRSITNLERTWLANADFRFPGKLVEKTQGRFVVLCADDGTGEHILALPALDRMGGADEFNYYQEFFDCDRPVGGDIFVVRPAEVVNDKERGLWLLNVRGKLEIKR